MGRHCPGFLPVLWSALIRLDYDGPIPIYLCHPFQAHGLNIYDVWVERPVGPTALWKVDIIGS
jgi:hypothetical protein